MIIDITFTGLNAGSFNNSEQAGGRHLFKGGVYYYSPTLRTRSAILEVARTMSTGESKETTAWS